jgi:hypothetical protein
MALPQQVVEQLSQEEAPRTPGWSFGIMLFSGSILLIVVVIFAGLRFGYEPYLTGQLNGLQGQVNDLGQSISPAQEVTLSTFYSQISNLQLLMKHHVMFSQFFDWIEKNTEANVYYNSMNFTSNDQVTLMGNAKTSADIPEQVAIFEASPDITSVVLSNVSYSPSANDWIFNVELTMDPDLLQWSSGSFAPAATSTAGAASVPAAASTPLPTFGAPASGVSSSIATGTGSLPQP